MTPSAEILLGPPGCGKTTALLEIVREELARGVPPDRIGFVTFTRRAALEARERASIGLGLSGDQLRWFRTLHSLAFAALGLSPSDVLSGSRLREWGDWARLPVAGAVVEEELDEDPLAGSSRGVLLGDRCVYLDNLARVRGVPLLTVYEEAGAELPRDLIEFSARSLEEWKRGKHLVDFTDMLEMFCDSGWDARLEVLLVDEGQDLSELQWRAASRLARGARRVVVAGDDDQAIYRWAGAAVDAFLGLPGRARVLGQSYRVPAASQSLAAGLLAERVRERRPKIWRPRSASGEVERVGSPNDLPPPPSGANYLVLARNSHLLVPIAKNLRADGVVYELRGKSSVPLEQLEAILAWERLRRGEKITLAAAKLVYSQMEVNRGYVRGYRELSSFSDEDEIGMEDLRERGGLLSPPAIWHEALSRVPASDRAYLVRALRRGERPSRRPTVRLSTIHGSKGGEADHVVLLRDQARRTHEEAQLNPEDEARVFYVGVTRAREKLTIVAPQTRRSYDV